MSKETENTPREGRQQSGREQAAGMKRRAEAAEAKTTALQSEVARLKADLAASQTGERGDKPFAVHATR